MTITLMAKDKLAFIKGKCEKPNFDLTIFEKWRKVDNMVAS